MAKIYLKPPPAFVLPEGKKDGDTFSVLAEFKIEGDQLCLVGIDGNDLAKSDDEPEPGKRTEARYNEEMENG